MADPNPELRDWLALIRAPRVGSLRFNTLLEHFESPTAILTAKHSELTSAGLASHTIEYLRTPDWAAVDKDLAWLDDPNAHILTLKDEAYPALLHQIPDPPPVLYVLGDPKALNHRQLAIVGSRNPTPLGRETAHNFAHYLTDQGFTITSGLALGIDAASHEGALAAGGMSIAVAGTGLDRVYPAKHHDLAHRIAHQGALVSEFSPGTPPIAKNFPRRNRIISGLSLGVLVVEAALKSGSLITARSALEQGREVFALPGSLHNPQSKGCNALIREGAKLVEEVYHILEELPVTGLVATENATIQTPSKEDGLDKEYKMVLECIGFEPTSVDSVIEHTGLTANAVCSMLLVLELQDHIVSLSGGYYVRSK